MPHHPLLLIAAVHHLLTIDAISHLRLRHRAFDPDEGTGEGAGRLRHDRGQATTEYALVLLAAALVALLVVAWATAGGGAAQVSRLFNRVLDRVIQRV